MIACQVACRKAFLGEPSWSSLSETPELLLKSAALALIFVEPSGSPRIALNRRIQIPKNFVFIWAHFSSVIKILKKCDLYLTGTTLDLKLFLKKSNNVIQLVKINFKLSFSFF
jgi:hypothetical protein